MFELLIIETPAAASYVMKKNRTGHRAVPDETALFSSGTEEIFN